MKCPFCNQPCIMRQDEPAFTEAYWRCYAHKDLSVFVVVRYDSNNISEIIRYMIDTFINDKEYRVSVDLVADKTRVFQIIYDVEMQYSWFDEIREIKIPHALNITPDNAKEKLKTYLTFL